METQTINWRSLPDSQKAKVLEQARTYMRQQVSETRFCRSLADIYKIEV
jgi:predicted Fe-S protein YdhL (DUF1289 family)